MDQIPLQFAMVQFTTIPNWVRKCIGAAETTDARMRRKASMRKHRIILSVMKYSETVNIYAQHL